VCAAATAAAAAAAARFDEIMADIEGGMFGDKDYFKPLVDSISNMKVGNDWFLVANDFASYLDAQEEVDRVSGAHCCCCCCATAWWQSNWAAASTVGFASAVLSERYLHTS
jgi:glucan phosphorylase